MDSNLLKVFVAVAQEQSISLGAKKLGFAQSNVTSRIKQLEKSLEVDLFHRTPKGVMLTAQGEKLYPHAIDIVKKVEIATKAMKNVHEQERLKVGSTESNAAIRMAPFLLKLHKTYPKMQIELSTNTTKYVLKMLQEYQVDIAFISGIPQSKDLMILNQFEEQMVLIQSKENPQSNTYLAFKDGCAYNDFTIEYLKQMGNNEYKLLEFGSYETILGCVEAGIGKAILPLNIVKKLGFEAKLCIKKLDKQQAYIPTCLVCRKDYVPSIKEYLEEIEF